MTDGLVAHGKWDTFLTLEEEQLLLVRRKHIFVVVFPILLTSLFASILLFLAFFLFNSIFHSLSLFFISTLLVASVSMSIITKSIIDWYFHIYIVTNRKILEICYTPLASRIVSDVLLDKVSCTEVDLEVNGFFHELIDMGDVIVTFDRPTHQSEFILKDIKGANEISKFLTQTLIDHQVRNPMQPIWFQGPRRFLTSYR